MRRITHKLKSRRGASLIFALLLFFVASMVSMLILTASLTAAKRMRDDRDREQAYLTLSSAARTVKKSMESSWVTFTEKEFYRNGTRESYTFSGYSHAGSLGETLENCVKALNAFPPADGTLRGAVESPGYAGKQPSCPVSITVTASEVDRFKSASTADSSTMRLKKADSAYYYPIDAVLELEGQKIYIHAEAAIYHDDDLRSYEEPVYGEGDVVVDYNSIDDNTYRTIIKWERVELSTVPPKG